MLGHGILATALLLASASAQSQVRCTVESTRTVTVFTHLNDGAQAAPTSSSSSSSSNSSAGSDTPPLIQDSPIGDGELANITDAQGKTGLSNAVAPASGTYRNVVYFTNWGTYGANHQPADIQAGQITHLLYSFADIRPDGEVVSSDAFADLEKRYPSDRSESGTNAYGCVKQLFIQKKKNRHLKLLLSIGGWTWSPKFAPVARTDAGRRRFATSAVKLMGDWGFDGLDVDWEYPQNAAEAADFVRLLQECRRALDDYAARNARGYRFALTIAVPAGATNYQRLDMRRMAPLVDGWHLMAYDYTGSWAANSGHQANLYRSRSNAAATPADTQTALAYYLSQGIDPRKILIGLPLYGRSFMNTAGLGRPYRGQGKGSIEEGVWHYKALPQPGAQEFWDAESFASYSYGSRSRELVTYDNVRSAQEKAKYLVRQKLGGAVFWESSGDRTGSASLVGTVARGVGQLDRSQNLLSYPASRYDNIRRGVPGA